MLPHCRHVFFAGCHDEGYVTFLSPYKHNQQIAPKITLVETYGTRPKYHELGFGMTKLPDIFRAEDFPPPPTSHPPVSPSSAPEQPNRSNGVASPFSPIENRAPTPVTSATTGAASWASSARNGLPASSRMIDIAPAKRATDGAAKKYYLVNAQNERVDEALPKTTPQMYEQFNARIQNENGGRKFCNQCNFFGPETCNQLTDYRHGRVMLPPGEALVLRHMVRNNQCSESSWCADVNCPYSHHCRYGYMCTKGEACKFSSTHHVNAVCWLVLAPVCRESDSPGPLTDTTQKPNRKIFADGSSKLI